MSYRTLLLLCILSSAALSWAQDGQTNDHQNQQERILSYDSVIEIQADASLRVTETIKVRSTQQRIRRGIYRDFPTRYRDRFNNRVVVDFELINVQRDGRDEPWFTERMNNGVRINTGDDDFLPGPGVYTYTITYRTQRQLGFFENHDELYWNVTGLGWDFTIDQASATVRLPEPVDSNQLELTAFTGPSGSTESQATFNSPSDRVANFETTQPLSPYEGLTIVVEFPKGIVEAPTRQDRMFWLLRDNRGLIVMLIGLIGVSVFYWRAWIKHGRGPDAGVIVTRYEPPPSYSPAGLRYVLKEGYDQRGFMADLVSLAVRGLLKIEREDKALGDDWQLIRSNSPIPPDITPSERALIDQLFANDTIVKLEQSSETAALMQAVMAAHKKAIHGRYQNTYVKPNYGILTIGWIASLIIVVLGFVVSGGPGVPTVVIGLIILPIVNLVFSLIMSAPTQEGRKLRDHIEGLQRYLTIAEKDDLARLQQPDPNAPTLNPERFEKLLPYAMALKVEDAWTEKFTRAVGQAAADQATKNMSWYAGSGAASSSLSAMSSSLSKGLSSSISSAASPPGSSAGGGGFSGGGGGGGGGGGR